MSDESGLEARLSAVKARRGYLLPHHGLMALTSPRLLDAYDQAYAALALDQRLLSVHDRECVWLAILIATDEAAATHHVPKLLAAGGTLATVEAVLGLTAWAAGGPGYLFVARWWAPHLDGFDLTRAYGDALARVSAGIEPRIAAMCAAATHAARGDFELLRQAIPLAYRLNVPEAELAEALSLVMFPGSVPYFVETARVWLELIREGAVQPGPAFAAWARLQGQGGYDEASGKASGKAWPERDNGQ
jgi:alkylhydroperoxidase/carboxymuconolactone decarboxylase family protein YurZ